MKTVPHRRHRHSEGPGYHRWAIVVLAVLGLVHLCYLIAGAYFSGFGGALMTVWLLLPVFGGVRVGAGGVAKGGMAAFLGTLLLVANYWFPSVGYVGWLDRPSTAILLVAPVIHWVVVFTVSVLLSALSKR